MYPHALNSLFKSKALTLLLHETAHIFLNKIPYRKWSEYMSFKAYNAIF